MSNITYKIIPRGKDLESGCGAVGSEYLIEAPLFDFCNRIATFDEVERFCIMALEEIRNYKQENWIG